MQNRPATRISGPSELVRAVPHLLGFQPKNGDLVLVGMANGHLVCTARVDIADMDNQRLLIDTAGALYRGGVENILAIIYTGVPLGLKTLHAELVGRLRFTFDASGIDVRDIVEVNGTRYRSTDCINFDCCPPTGNTLQTEPGQFEAFSTANGMSPLPTRAALGDMLLPASQQVTFVAVKALTARHAIALTEGDDAQRYATTLLSMLVSYSERMETVRAELTDQQVIEIGAALAITPIRDAYWAWLDSAHLDGHRMLLDVLRRLPGEHAAPAVFLFGWGSWRKGNGALAGFAARRTLEIDPTYGAASLLIATLEVGMDPRTAPSIADQLA